jgi:RimJ/RimL family protein N-acetyltransferase/glycosyltransferase involved in cell wall biosynthesis
MTIIRPLELGDAEISHKWRNDPEVWKFTGSRPDIHITEEIERNWIENKLKESDSKRFAIVHDNIYVGNIQLTNISPNEAAEYHIFIGDKSFWNKGIAKIATNLLIEYAKNELKLKKIYLFVNPLNLSAIKVYEKSGFKTVTEEVKMELDLEPSKFLVSVFMITYNHGRFIKEALDGILNQKVNFDLEIIVGEDCSSDNTREILLEYKNKYPNLFQLLLHSPNVGAKQNHILTQTACKGKYIAFCEGDDYWTDPYKLQKQVDFLESNHEYSHCWTRFKKFNQNTQEITNDNNSKFFNKNEKGIDFTFEKFTSGWELGIQTLVFRNSHFPNNSFNKYKYFRDVHLIVELLVRGKGYCINNICAIYRKHENGIFSGINEEKINYEAFLIFKEIFYVNKEILELKKPLKYYLDKTILTAIEKKKIIFSIKLILEYNKLFHDVLVLKHYFKLLFFINKK